MQPEYLGPSADRDVLPTDFAQPVEFQVDDRAAAVPLDVVQDWTVGEVAVEGGVAEMASTTSQSINSSARSVWFRKVRVIRLFARVEALEIDCARHSISLRSASGSGTTGWTSPQTLG